MDDTEKPLFLLGVGAQKAGTSWLHSYLEQNPMVDMGFQKEYHIWDAKYRPGMFKGFVAKPKKGESAANAMRRFMQNRAGVYEQYFRDLISDKVRITGDLTPSYSALSVPQLARVRDKLVSVGFQVKAVLLMRDPVDRCWSATRMHTQTLKGHGVDMTDEQIFSLFVESFVGRQSELRTRYENTIKALNEVFSPDAVYVGIYEEMFNEAPLRRLSEFLTVPFNASHVSVKVNQSWDIPLPLDLRKRCADFYAETYAYCHEHYPQTVELWQPLKTA